jgi:hypothetical protein
MSVNAVTPLPPGNSSKDAPLSRRWILVAGTGTKDRIPESDALAATAIGDQLALYGYGLITGGWNGVDAVVTASFLNRLHGRGEDPKDRLIQVLPKGRRPQHKEGSISTAPHGGMEWLEPQKYADAVILIGGRGGTFSTWLGALHDGLPRFPFGGTHGDAELAFRYTLDLWELIPIPGITRDAFKRLEREIKFPSDAQDVARYLVEELLVLSLTAIDDRSRRAIAGEASIFISYSRKDSKWVNRLRVLMRPYERRGILSSWIDTDIEAGKSWASQLLGRLETTQAAMLLVTNNLLQSDYVRNIEIPAFMERLKTPSFHLFWSLLEPCDWQSLQELKTVQAIGDVTTAISECPTEADKQCRLIELVSTMARTISPSVGAIGT